MIDLNIGIYTEVKIQPVEFYTEVKFVKMSYLWLPGLESNQLLPHQVRCSPLELPWKRVAVGIFRRSSPLELPVGLEPTKACASSFADCFLCRSDSWQHIC